MQPVSMPARSFPLKDSRKSQLDMINHRKKGGVRWPAHHVEITDVVLGSLLYALPLALQGCNDRIKREDTLRQGPSSSN